MPSLDDARVWLRNNGYPEVADNIDGVMRVWRERGVQTRRNWWDVLAGSAAGLPRKIEGIEFPVLAAARRRKQFPPIAGAIELHPGEEMPLPEVQARWKPKATKTVASPKVRPTMTQRTVEVEVTTKRVTKTRISRPDDEPSLSIKKFAQLENVIVPLRDLVVLVGPQATGKSLVLELLKLVIDRNRIVRSLRDHGFKWESAEGFSALYFGGGFGKSWGSQTEVTFGRETVTLNDVARARAYRGEDAVFYIPAHRTLAIAEGYPRPFAQYQVETPYVARRFSEALLTSLNQGLIGKGKIFPHDRRLKDAFRRLIDEAVFHGATLKLETREMRKQFVLEYEHGEARLPFMAWTAGQREFTPMLLGLYHLLPAGGSPKKKEIQWAILEEPEMGLHPKAIVAVMAVVLDLLARGYKVALSTHSPTVLEVVWGMSRLKDVEDGPARLCRMMGLSDKDKNLLKTASNALATSYAVVHVQHDVDGRVISKDISRLDPGAEDRREWGWGGLTGFSASVADVLTGARRGA